MTRWCVHRQDLFSSYSGVYTYGSGMIHDQVVCPPTCRNYLVLIVVCTAMIHDQVVCPPTGFI